MRLQEEERSKQEALLRARKEYFSERMAAEGKPLPARTSTAADSQQPAVPAHQPADVPPNRSASAEPQTRVDRYEHDNYSNDEAQLPPLSGKERVLRMREVCI